MYAVILAEKYAPENLSIEEDLLRNNKDEYFLLYRNAPCVVIGKNQIAQAECRFLKLQEKKIPIFRRISGGGAVYHDVGNLNFSFILNATEGKQIHFSKYLEPIIFALREMGLPVQYDNRHNLLLHGFKISGNAEYVLKNRVLHHGTLLFNCNLKEIDDTLTPENNKYLSHSTHSVSTSVENISKFIGSHIDIQKFTYDLFSSVCKTLNAEVISLGNMPLHDNRINYLNKFNTDEWNLYNGPDYTFYNEASLFGKKIKVKFDVQHGWIQKFNCNFIDESCNKNTDKILFPIRHHPKAVEEYLFNSLSNKQEVVTELIKIMF